MAYLIKFISNPKFKSPVGISHNTIQYSKIAAINAGTHRYTFYAGSIVLSNFSFSRGTLISNVFKKTYLRAMNRSLSDTEENYLKGIYKLSLFETGKVSNNSIASLLNVNPASVLEMLRKLEKKKLIVYDKVKGARLTPSGKQIAVYTIRKHRLWEVFLAEKLGFGWDEIHEIAEQMEHIQSKELVERLDKFLGHPKFDPHGDPIPDPQGRFNLQEGVSLETAQLNKEYRITGVKDHHDEFLKFLSRSGLDLGIKIKVVGMEIYDDSLRLLVGKKEITISRKVAQNLIVKKIQR